MIRLVEVKHSDTELRLDMSVHYSQPQGFVGRSICYEIRCNGRRYGSVVAGSATRFLPGRKAFLSMYGLNERLENVINNLFYHVERIGGEYPVRNFVPTVLSVFRGQAAERWQEKYGDEVVAFESLVELPRTGDCYRRDGWADIGVTKGYTCKREGGTGTDSWSGKRVWNTTDLRPKRVFMRVA